MIYTKIFSDADLPPGLIAKLQDEPISLLQWIHRDELNPNLYNPNKMAPPELELLESSILSDGWLFPICALPKDVHVEGLTDNADHSRNTIIDGFHRYLTSGRPRVYERTGGYVPVVFPTGNDHIATTVRMNRIKGTHTVVGMADIVVYLLQNGKDAEYIMKEYGMEQEEVVRLANSKGIPKTDIIKNSDFSTAWIPGKQ
jgi:hypothetical protein